MIDGEAREEYNKAKMEAIFGRVGGVNQPCTIDEKLHLDTVLKVMFYFNGGYFW